MRVWGPSAKWTGHPRQRGPWRRKLRHPVPTPRRPCPALTGAALTPMGRRPRPAVPLLREGGSQFPHLKLAGGQVPPSGRRGGAAAAARPARGAGTRSPALSGARTACDTAQVGTLPGSGLWAPGWAQVREGSRIEVRACALGPAPAGCPPQDPDSGNEGLGCWLRGQAVNFGGCVCVRESPITLGQEKEEGAGGNALAWRNFLPACSPPCLGSGHRAPKAFLPTIRALSSTSRPWEMLTPGIRPHREPLCAQGLHLDMFYCFLSLQAWPAFTYLPGAFPY